MKAVVAEKLSKIYPGGNKAVDNISFSLDEGEIFGFLGPNGAGKTTTIKMLCGMLTPTEGICRVFDYDPVTEPGNVHQIAGVLTEHAQMYDHMSGLENLMFYGELFGIEKAECKQRAIELLKRLGLEESIDRKLSAYSTGMRQRLSIGRAMLHSPRILFLDEPTSGLDPESAQNVNSLIREIAVNGTTIFLCTHQLRYAQEICTKYGLMNQGDLFAMGTLDELRAMIDSNLRVRIKTDFMPEDVECEKIEDDFSDYAIDNTVDNVRSFTYLVKIKSLNEIPSIAKKIVDAGGSIYHIAAERMPLEDIYFSLINQELLEMEGENI